MTIHPQTNEIRDYLARAPRRWSFDGLQMVNHTHSRLTWLASIARGTLNSRINRRAGIVERERPFCYPEGSSARRKQRRLLVIAGFRNLTSNFNG